MNLKKAGTHCAANLAESLYAEESPRRSTFVVHCDGERSTGRYGRIAPPGGAENVLNA